MFLVLVTEIVKLFGSDDLVSYGAARNVWFGALDADVDLPSYADDQNKNKRKWRGK